MGAIRLDDVKEGHYTQDDSPGQCASSTAATTGSLRSSADLASEEQHGKVLRAIIVKLEKMDKKLDQLTETSVWSDRRSWRSNDRNSSVQSIGKPFIGQQPEFTFSTSPSAPFIRKNSGVHDEGLEYASESVCRIPSNDRLSGAQQGCVRSIDRSSATSEMACTPRSSMPSMAVRRSISFIVATETAKVGFQKAREFSLRVWSLLDDPDSGFCAWLIHVLMMGMITFGVVITLLQTTDYPVFDTMQAAIIETSVDGVFILEVVLRFVACPNRIGFLRSIYNVIDVSFTGILALRISSGFTLPDNQDMYTPAHLVLVTVVPTLRLLKVLRRSQNLRLLWYAAAKALEALVVPVFVLLVLCLAFSGIIYVLEPRENIHSLPHAMWLVLVTVSTVGYGQTMPSTVGGFMVSTILVVCGVLYMALPISIVGQAWDDVWSRRFELLLMDRYRERLGQQGFTFDEITRLFGVFDANNDQLLDIHEFSEMLSEMRLGLSTENIADLFDTLDQDKNGVVDAYEFARVLFPAEYLEQDKIRRQSHRNSKFQERPMGNHSSSLSNSSETAMPKTLSLNSNGSARSARQSLNTMSFQLAVQKGALLREQSPNAPDSAEHGNRMDVFLPQQSPKAPYPSECDKIVDGFSREQSPNTPDPADYGKKVDGFGIVQESSDYGTCSISKIPSVDNAEDDELGQERLPSPSLCITSPVPPSQHFVDCLLSVEGMKHI